MRNVSLHRPLNSSSSSSIRFDLISTRYWFVNSQYLYIRVYVCLSLWLCAYVNKKSLSLSFTHMRNESDTYKRAASLSPFLSFSLSLVRRLLDKQRANSWERKRERNRSEWNFFLTVNRKGEAKKDACADVDYIQKCSLMIFLSSSPEHTQTWWWWCWSKYTVDCWLTKQEILPDDQQSNFEARARGRFHRHWWWCKFAFHFHCRCQYRETNVYHIDQWRSKVEELSNVTAKTIL